MKRYKLPEGTMEQLIKGMIPSEAAWYIDNLQLNRDQKIQMFQGMKDIMDWKSKDSQRQHKDMPNWFGNIEG